MIPSDRTGTGAPAQHGLARRYRRPLVLSITASVLGEAVLLVVYGMVLHPEGDLLAKVLWTLVFCGLGMGSVVGALIVLLVVDRLDGVRAVLATSAISAGVIGVLCNVLCYRLDRHYFHYFGAAENPGSFLAPGIIFPGVLGVVADVDNDGSAEIVVVSNETTTNESGAPTVQVIRDKEDRWIQARRIWNQHTYHVTNVREDATIPQFETPNWLELNTYRVNAQIAKGGGVCKPKPQG